MVYGVYCLTKPNKKLLTIYLVLRNRQSRTIPANRAPYFKASYRCMGWNTDMYTNIHLFCKILPVTFPNMRKIAYHNRHNHVDICSRFNKFEEGLRGVS